MNSIVDFYTRLGSRLYKWRWHLVAMFFSPFFLPLLPSSNILVLLAVCIYVSSFFMLGVVLSYGPISHFKGSMVWEGWQSMAWLFLTLFAFSVVWGVGSMVFQYAQNS